MRGSERGYPGYNLIILVHVKKPLKSVIKLVHVIAHTAFKPFSINLVDKIIVQRPQELEERSRLPSLLLVKLQMKVYIDKNLAIAYLYFLIVHNSINSFVIFYQYPYVRPRPCIITPFFPGPYMPFYEFSFLGFMLEVLHLVEIKSTLPQKSVNMAD